MSALRNRLGEFEPGPMAPPMVPVPPRPVDRSAPSLASYIAERHKHLDTPARREQTVTRQRNEWAQLLERQRKERADVLGGSWRGRGDLLNAARSLMATQQAQEKAEVRDRHRVERSALTREQGVFPSYEEWLMARNPDAADKWRHRERRPATIEGPTFRIPVPHDIRAVRAVIDGWKVNYYMVGTRPAPSFTDRGKTIDIHDSRSRESVHAALQLSAQKWGTISVRGDEQFKRTCVASRSGGAWLSMALTALHCAWPTPKRTVRVSVGRAANAERAATRSSASRR